MKYTDLHKVQFSFDINISEELFWDQFRYISQLILLAFIGILF